MPTKRTVAAPKTKKSRAKVKDLSVTAKELGQRSKPVMGGGKRWTFT